MSGIMLNILVASLGDSSIGLIGLLTPRDTTTSKPKLAIRNNELYAVVNNNDFTVLKLDLDLAIIWQKTLVVQTAAAIAVDSSGNVIAGGNKLNSTVPNGYVIKYDSSGTVQWQRQTDGNSQFRGIAVDSADNIYCMGYDNFSATDRDIYIAKFDPSGTAQYQRRLTPNFSLNESAEGIAITSPTVFSIVGEIPSVFRSFFYIVDQATASTITASQTLFVSASASSQRGVAVSAGEEAGVAYFLVDRFATNSSSSKTTQVLIRRVDNTVSWQVELSSSAGSLRGAGLCMNPSGTHVYTLASSVGTTGVLELLLCKYVASTGALEWQRTLRATGVNITASSIAVDSFDNIYAFSGIFNNSLVLKVPGDGSGVGSSTSIGGSTYNYVQTTHSVLSSSLVFQGDGVGSSAPSTTILTPTDTPTNGVLTMAVAPL